MDKENNNDPLKIWGLYLFVLAFPGKCVNQLGSEVKSIPERSAGWFKTLDVWHRLMLCDINFFFIDMKFGINQAISQAITQLSCIQLETPSSRLWNFWWIKTYTTFNSSDAGDGIFRFGASIPCLLIPWLLKFSKHQQAWYCQYRMGNMQGCSIGKFVFFCWPKSKIWYEMWIHLLQFLKQFIVLSVKGRVLSWRL